MAYENFIPELWAEGIERELERNHVFVEDTNRKYEGIVKAKGDTVKILGIEPPTVTLVGKGAFSGVGTPETPSDNSAILAIDQMAWYNFAVDDIDKAQAVGGIMEALKGETAEMLADVEDAHVAKQVWDSSVATYNASAAQLTSSTILPALLGARQKLAENDVSRKTEVVVTLPPWAVTLYKEAMGIGRATNAGDELLRKGIVDYFDGMTIKESNNVAHKTISGNDVYGIQVKTKRAIAYARPVIHSEAFRPETQFSDALKGFILFGAKVARPKEIINLNVYA